MNAIEGCQVPCLPRFSDGLVDFEAQPAKLRLKRMLAKPWNYHVKSWLKYSFSLADSLQGSLSGNSETAAGLRETYSAPALQAGDLVRVRSVDEVRETLDRWNEVKGCAFLDGMWQYCGTTQRVLRPMERFLDERDYKVKKCKGLVVLDGVICNGTPVFGRCDRCCHLFWRVEWLEKIEAG